MSLRTSRRAVRPEFARPEPAGSAFDVAAIGHTTEVNADDQVAHYTEGYKTFDGLAFPTRRRVYHRNPDGTPDRSVTAITLDIHDITAALPRGAAAGLHASGREIRSDSF